MFFTVVGVKGNGSAGHRFRHIHFFRLPRYWNEKESILSSWMLKPNFSLISRSVSGSVGGSPYPKLMEPMISSPALIGMAYSRRPPIHSTSTGSPVSMEILEALVQHDSLQCHLPDVNAFLLSSVSHNLREA